MRTGWMRFGVSSTLLWGYSLVDGARLVAQYGYDAFEIWVDQIIVNGEDVKELGKVLDKLPIIPTVHAASWDLNLTSINEKVREFSLKMVRMSLEVASQLGSHQLTVHPGRESFSGVSREVYCDLHLAIFSELAREAEKRGILICIENIECLPRELLVTSKDFKFFFERWSGSNLAVTLDVSHLGSAEATHNFFTELAHRIAHVHLSDRLGSKFHLPLGEGDIDLASIFKILKEKFTGIVIVEGYYSRQDCRQIKAAKRTIAKLKSLC